MQPPDSQPAAGPAADITFPRAGVACVTLRGEHDLSTRPLLTAALAQAIEQANVIVDLSECTFMDSSVIAALFQAGRNLSALGGRLELVIPAGTGTIQRTADLTSLASILPVHETAAAALASFEPREHTIQIRDLRARFGDDECSCGWRGQSHTGAQRATRDARRDGLLHIERQGPARPPI
jgi:anti-anti-sigma factor